MDELLAVHKALEHHVVRMMDRQGEMEAMMKRLEAMMNRLTDSNVILAERQIDIESLVKQVAENNIRLSRIIEIHDYSIDELDARLRRLEERRPRGRA